MDMDDPQVQDILNVTALSIAKHCGLVDDASNPDDRSEDRRYIDLSRQVRLPSNQKSCTPEVSMNTSLVSYKHGFVETQKRFTGEPPSQ